MKNVKINWLNFTVISVTNIYAKNVTKGFIINQKELNISGKNYFLKNKIKFKKNKLISNKFNSLKQMKYYKLIIK